MWPNPQETADLVTFTEKIFNEKFLRCVKQNTSMIRFYNLNLRTMFYNHSSHINLQ